MIRLPMLDAKDPVEVIALEFDYAAELGVATLTGAPVVAVTAHRGVDADPAAMLYGAPVVEGASVVQLLRGGLAGVTYKAKCQATLSDGRVLVLSGLLPVRVL